MDTNAIFLNEYDYFYDPDEAYVLLEGYRLAAKKLALACNDKVDGDQLLYPALFVFRHYIELSIKEIYMKYLTLSDITFDRSDVNGHFLKRDELENLIQWVAEEYDEEFPVEVMEVIDLLHDADAKSDFFRYTHNNRGAKFRSKKLRVDHEKLTSAVNKVTDFFHGFYLWVDEMVEQKSEYERDLDSGND